MRVCGALLTTLDMPAERRRAAALDRRHHLQLVEAEMAGIGRTPRRPVVAEDIRDLQPRTGQAAGAYAGGCPCFLSCSSVGPSAGLCAPLAWLRQHVEWALDVGDHAGRDAGIARRCIELVVPQERLDDPDIGAALKKMGGEAVAQHMQASRSF